MPEARYRFSVPPALSVTASSSLFMAATFSANGRSASVRPTPNHVSIAREPTAAAVSSTRRPRSTFSVRRAALSVQVQVDWSLNRCAPDPPTVVSNRRS